MKSKDKALLRQHWVELSTRSTDDGTEKLCPCCGDWWPLTVEFFTFIETRSHYHSHCRACRSEASSKRYQRRKHIQGTAEKLTNPLVALLKSD